MEDPNQFAKPESFEKAMVTSKYFKVNLDIGHFVAANYDPLDYIEKHHTRIPLIHVKDRKKDQGASTVWGEGDTPIEGVLQLIKGKSSRSWRISSMSTVVKTRSRK